MQKTTDFLALPILSIDDAAILGEVKTVYFDRLAKQALYLSLLLNDKLTLLPFDKIIAKADAIVIDSTLSLIDACDTDMTSLTTLDGKVIFSASGENKGKIDYAELFASGKTTKIYAGDVGYTLSAFQAFGDVLLLKQIKKHAIKHAIPKDKLDRKVEIFDIEGDGYGDLKKQNQTKHPATPKTNFKVQDNILPPMFSKDALEKIVGKEVIYDDTDERTPARVITDYDFLLGRTLLRDLNTYAGTLLAAQGTVVTKELVETAARYGKLVDLTLNSSYK